MPTAPSFPSMARLSADRKMLKARIASALARWAHDTAAGILLARHAELEVADCRFVVSHSAFAPAVLVRHAEPILLYTSATRK